MRINHRTILFKLVLACLCAGMWQPVTAQEVTELTGVIVDAENGEPVPFASVGVTQQQIGISSNYNGYFNLRLKSKDRSHSLEFSSIGYERLIIPFSDLDFNTPLQVKLVPRATILSEIVITGKSQTLEELVLDVSKSRKTFLRSKPYLMNALYRETITREQEYLGFTEAQGMFYVNGYNPRYKNNKSQVMTYDLAQWKHIRRSNYPSPQYIRIGKLLKAKDYYLHDGPLARKALNHFNYQIKDSTQYHGAPVLRVEFTPKDPGSRQFNYSGMLVLSQEDNALLELSIEQTGSSWFLKEAGEEEEVSSSFFISFIKFDEKYYLGRCSFMQLISKAGDRNVHQMEIQGGMFAQQQPQYMSKAQRAVLYSEMLNPIVHYDSNFWSTFKMAESNMLLDLLQQRDDLMDQFEQNNQQRLLPLPPGVDSYEQMVDEQNFLDFFMQY